MANSSSLSMLDRYNVAVQAGFSQIEAIAMTAISLRECGGCDMSGVNNGGAIGLFQIQNTWFTGSNAGNSYGTGNAHNTIWGDLSDPLDNAKAAHWLYSKSGGGTAGFNNWCVYPTGCNQTNAPNQYTWTTWAQAIAAVTSAVQSGGISVNPPPSNPPPSNGGGSGGGSGGGNDPVAGTVSGAISGPIVFLAAILFIIIGALMWKGSTVVKTTTQVVKTAAAA